MVDVDGKDPGQDCQKIPLRVVNRAILQDFVRDFFLIKRISEGLGGCGGGKILSRIIKESR